jgi:hypothetical protein
MVILLILLPAICSGIVALLNSSGINDRAERFESWLRMRQGEMSYRSGFIWKWVIHPPFLLIVKVCEWTDSISHRGVRNGVRVAIGLYLFIICISLLMYALFLILILIVIGLLAAFGLKKLGKK